jgi:SAM-dependent methyltransferase
MGAGSMTLGAWPKQRPTLTERQQHVYEEWNAEFLAELKPGSFGWISRFDHRFAAVGAGEGLVTLEIGAGTGTYLAYETTGEYVALEGLAELASMIPERPGLSIVIADCEGRLPYRDGYFDRVLAIHVLEHLYNLPATLDEVSRVLKPDGTFSVVIPCQGGRGYSLGQRFTSRRMFERRFPDLRYDWLIGYDHCNSAREVLGELERLFRVRRRRFFPTRMPSVDVNLTIGLELGHR